MSNYFLPLFFIKNLTIEIEGINSAYTNMKKVFQTYINSLKDGLNVIIIHFMVLSMLLPCFILFENYKTILLVLSGILFISLLLTINFFRNPQRNIKYKKNVVYAPADGVISSIDIVDENKYINKKAYRIKIFMNIFNVHRNRIPYTGDIKLVKYIKGKLQAAFKEIEDSNEQFIISLKTQHGIILLKQIAGLIARRIICNIKMGDKLQTGNLFGMIKFGSAVITYLPACTTITVKKGDKVKAGLSELGYFKK